MRRIVWVVLGAVAGVLAVRFVGRKVAQLTPEAMGGAFGQAAGRWQDFAATVREAMVEREIELREDLGFDQAGIPGGAGPSGGSQSPATGRPATGPARTSARRPGEATYRPPSRVQGPSDKEPPYEF